MESPKLNPYAGLAVGVIAVSTSAIFVRLTDASSEVIAFYRLLFSVLLLAPVFFPKYVKEVKGISKKDWLFTIIAGILLAFHFILWFESLNYTSVASSTVLVTLQPLFALLGTFLFFKERFSWKAIVCAVFAIFGSIIISWGDFMISGDALYGDFLALAACALITSYLLFGQTTRTRVSLVTYSFVLYSISTIVLFVYVFLSGAPFFSYPPKDWGYFLLMALIPNLLGQTIFNWCVKWVSTSTISVAILFEPVGAALLAYFLLGEKLIWQQILGGSIVIVSVVLYLLAETKKVKLNMNASEEAEAI